MNTPHMLRCLAMTLLIAASILQAPSRAHAQGDSSAAATRDHFKKDIAAYDENRFSDAAEEFATAHKLSPGAFKILFNIGQVNVALGRPIEAVDAYDKYLKQGGAALTAERRKEVQIKIEHQLARIGTLVVRTSPNGAEVRIGGNLIGVSPLPRAIRLAAGRHTVEALLACHLTQVREVEVSGRAEAVVELVLDNVRSKEPVAAASPLPVPTPASAHAPVVPVVIVTPGEQTPYRAPHTLSWSNQTEQSNPAASSSSINWQRVIGCVLLVGSLATATVGGLIAYKGSNQSDPAKERLENAKTDAEYDLAKPDYDAGIDRNHQGWTIAGVGAAGLVGGVLRIAMAPDKNSNVALRPWTTAGAGGIGLVLSGAW